MKKQQCFRILLQAFALAAFVFQMVKSISIYISKPSQVTISTTKFEDVPRPSVIVCPQDQFYPRELNKTGYYPIFHLFGGLHNKLDDNYLTWDGENSTFDEILDAIYLERTLNSEFTFPADTPGIVKQKTFIMGRGTCYTFLNYPSKIKVFSKVQFEALVSDPGKLVDYSADMDSMVGDIHVDNDEGNNSFLLYINNIKIEMTVNEMDDGTCKNYNTDKGESYGQCMDTYLAGVYKPELGCVPPWMSHTDQCKGIVGPVSKTTRSNLVNTSELVLDGFQISPPPECPPPCQTFLLSAVQKSKPRKVLGSNILKIYFEDTVTVKRLVPGYTELNLLVDLGSALGLWLGLSFIGIADLIMECFNRVKMDKFSLC